MLFSIVYGSCLPEDRNLNLAGVLQPFLDLLNNVPGKPHRPQIVNLLWPNQDANLTTGLDSISLLHPFEAARYILKRLQTLQVALQ